MKLNAIAAAVIVAYEPDRDALRALVLSLADQVTSIIVVDNSPASDERVPVLLRSLRDVRVTLIRLGTNRGVAEALNIGIHAARAAGATHILLSDQDSRPAPDMVGELLSGLDSLGREHAVGAVGPTYTDTTSGLTFPFQTLAPGRFFYSHAAPTPERPCVEALTLITSGTLIPVDVLDRVGLMREDFFIDHVDAEWCFRARAAGYKLFGIGSATMYHRLGDASLRVWYMGWRTESAYSPVRVYYRVRNFVALCKSTYVPAGVKIRSSWYTLGMMYTQCIFGPTRLRSLRFGLVGLWHGLRGRMGAYPG